MLEIIVTTLAAIVASVAAWYFTEWRKNNTARLENPRAPSNLLHHLAPGAAISKMRELLGAPYAEQSGRYSYRFSNLLLQIASEDRTTIDAVGLILPRSDKRAAFEIHPLNLVLGKMTIADVLEHDAKIKRETSSKHLLISVDRYYGNPGFYREYSFGVFSGPVATYPDQNIEWDIKKDRLLTNPKDLKINWVTISTGLKKGFHIDFWAFR